MLALDPPGDPTIGACLAGDLSGPRRHRYGAMRDLVIGVTVVLADGTIASSGGKVVKNVAGYDLGKLFSGSRGRLGLIARVALRLHPRPGRGGDRRRRDRRPARALAASCTARSSCRAPSTSCRRAGSRCSSRAARRRSTAQVAACPGERGRRGGLGTRRRALQLGGGGRRAVRLAGVPARRGPGPGIAFVDGPRERAWSPLAERVRAAFDPTACSLGTRWTRSLLDDCVHCGFCLPTLPDLRRSGTRRWTRRAGGSG